MKTISIVIPAHDESGNIDALYSELIRIWDISLRGFAYEFIFVDDGSRDDTVKRIAALCAKDPCVKFIGFSRNFGKEIATTAGLCAATGDAVMMIDADLQHPPRLIPQFIAEWEQGSEVIVGLRVSNSGEGFVKRWGSVAFHKLMDSIAEVEIKKGETDFRLLDRKVVEAFKLLPERSRMTRALINWLGFRRSYVTFVASARASGAPTYSTAKLIRLAFYSIATNSLFPLRIAGYLGLSIMLFSGTVGFAVLLERYVYADALSWHVSGPAQLALLTLFLIGIVLMSLGLIALYIENIHQQVLARPLFVVRERTNFDAVERSSLAPLAHVRVGAQAPMELEGDELFV